MISTHILDTTLGHPAKAVEVLLEKEESGQWVVLEKQSTNEDGRIQYSTAKNAGTYRLTFNTKNYFKKLSQESFFQNVQVCFEISDTSRKYHIPLLLNPFSYSTYRGS
jgi:5-hydroxyisourate hydrolase